MRPPRVRDRTRDETEVGAVTPMAATPELGRGTVLAGYRIDAVVGRGGMGVVYRAEHLHLNRTVALKVLLPELARDGSFRERFVRESRTAAALRHPNIVTIYDAGEADGLLYIAMQYVDGSDLAHLLEQPGALEPERALAILEPIAGALDAAHEQGLVHRDVKPANVLLDRRSSYLTDFGLVRSVSSATALTQHGQFVGTLDYMAPEQIEGGALDARADVYAFGCVLYHALAGSAPFEKDSPVSLIYAHMHEAPPSLLRRRPDLPGSLAAVLERALAKRREERYAGCEELIAEARAAIAGAAGAAASAPSPGRTAALTILVADADPAIRAAVRLSHGGQGFRVLDAADADKAFALARTERPALVFVDWNLPGAAPAGGFCRELRADPGTARARIVVFASRAAAVDEAEIRASGADDSIRKPFSALQLLYKVGEVLGVETLSR